jgi:nitrogen fixation protein FixH
LDFLDTAAQVLGNPHFEAWVAGPLMGVIAALVFAAVIKPPRHRDDDPRSRDARASSQEKNDRDSPRSEVHHHHHHHVKFVRPDDDSSGAMVLFATGLVLIVGLLLFCAYLPLVAGALYLFISSVAMFCATTLLVMLLSGRYGLLEWFNHAFFSFLIAVGCLYVAWLARTSISDQVVAVAQGLLNHSPKTIGSVVAAGWNFFQRINPAYVTWMLFEVAAFALTLLCTVMVFARTLHFVALVQIDPASNGGAWKALARRTQACAGLTGGLLTIGFFVAAWLFASGTVFQWTR